jgi:uncharacterized protein YceH (UPF0502 family)
MSETPSPAWKPLNSRQRRVLGVLVEKAKTTPDAYPLTVNAIVTGCNQKSNRDPLMNMTMEEVEEVLTQLRDLGAVTEVQGSGRVVKYRHRIYDWLGIDKLESAVMCELLLRGAQTLGELRGRAARMEPLPDLAALKPVLDLLLQKNLLLELTPAGRGQIVSHNLYKDRELEELRGTAQQRAQSLSATADPDATDDAKPVPAPVAASGFATRDMFHELVVDIAELRAEIARLRQRVQHLEDGTADAEGA